MLTGVESRGKHPLLHFDDLVLHSHLGMSGSWQVLRHGGRWRKPAVAAWAIPWDERTEAVQFGGPTLRVLTLTQLRHDPLLGKLGTDILAPDFDATRALSALRSAPARQGDANRRTYWCPRCQPTGIG